MEPLKLLTQKEYTDIRGCSIRTAERERETGDGCPYVRLGRRIYYRREDVERFINAHVRGTGQVDQVEAVAPAPSRRRGRPRKIIPTQNEAAQVT
jgi:hypothetical protein